MNEKLEIEKVTESELTTSIKKSLSKEATALAFANLSENTRRVYAYDIQEYLEWCEGLAIRPFPVSSETACMYVASMYKSNVSNSKINRSLSAIDKINRYLGNLPIRSQFIVNETIKGTFKQNRKPVSKVAAATSDRLTKMLKGMVHSGVSDNRIDRDSAIILIATWGALRPQEVANLRICDLSFKTSPGGESQSMLVRIRQSKTDQMGEGAYVPIPNTGTRLCAVKQVITWLARLSVTDLNNLTSENPLFPRIVRSKNGEELLKDVSVSGDGIRAIFKKYSEAVNIEKIRGHSGRAGFITEAANSGVPIPRIQKQSRHKSVSVLMGYFRESPEADDIMGLFGDKEKTEEGE